MFFILSVLFALWSRPNLKERDDVSKVLLCFVIFAPMSVFFAVMSLEGFSLIVFVPLILAYLLSNPLEMWIDKELNKG